MHDSRLRLCSFAAATCGGMRTYIIHLPKCLPSLDQTKSKPNCRTRRIQRQNLAIRATLQRSITDLICTPECKSANSRNYTALCKTISVFSNYLHTGARSERRNEHETQHWSIERLITLSCDSKIECLYPFYEIARIYIVKLLRKRDWLKQLRILVSTELTHPRTKWLTHVTLARKKQLLGSIILDDLVKDRDVHSDHCFDLTLAFNVQ